MHDVGSVLLDEEERDVEAHIAKKPRKAPEIEICLTKKAPIDHSAVCLRLYPCSDCEERYCARDKGYQGDTADGPAEAYLRLKLVKHDRVDYATD